MKRPVGRPPMRPDERRVRVQIMLDPGTLARLDELADLDGRSRGEVVDELVWRSDREEPSINEQQ